jgi:hypothetical protein
MLFLVHSTQTVYDLGNVQMETTNGSVGPTDLFGEVHWKVNHKFISHESFAIDSKLQIFLNISRK